MVAHAAEWHKQEFHSLRVIGLVFRNQYRLLCFCISLDLTLQRWVDPGYELSLITPAPSQLHLRTPLLDSLKFLSNMPSFLPWNSRAIVQGVV